MRIVKYVAGGILAYVGLVVVVESTLGFLQPEVGGTFLLTTTDEAGVARDRVLVQNWSGGRLYASANHWPRAWYENALRNPRVRATLEGTAADYLAVPVDDEEHRRIEPEIGNGLAIKFLFGFAPQRFLRLDPVEGP